MGTAEAFSPCRQQIFRFSDLPTAIRLMIYHYTLLYPAPLNWRGKSSPSIPQPINHLDRLPSLGYPSTTLIEPD